MQIIGLTGGIATGKSTAAEFFGEMNIPIVDADEWAHRLLMPGNPNYSRVIQTFGPGILGQDGVIDRKMLGQIVFSDPCLLRRLEEITHPAIRHAIADEISTLAAHGEPVVILDHPLLFEMGMESMVDETWVVTASPEIQRARLAARDGLSPEAIEERLAAQIPLEEKARRAQVVLDNGHNIEDFRALLIRTWKERVTCNPELP